MVELSGVQTRNQASSKYEVVLSDNFTQRITASFVSVDASVRDVGGSSVVELPLPVGGAALSSPAQTTALLTSRGWSSFIAMKGHCDRHLGGYLDGELPLEWLQSVGYGICEVCNRILSSRYRGRCPSCWPAFVESQPRPVSGRPLTVLLGARDLWSTRLNAALAGIIAHRDTRAWIDFLILPSLVPHVEGFNTVLLYVFFRDARRRMSYLCQTRVSRSKSRVI